MLAAKSGVLLTNYIPPYRLPLFRSIASEFGAFKVLESFPMAPDRPWTAQHDGLQVETQNTFTFKRIGKHPVGFRDRGYVHVPCDTLGRLNRIKPDIILSSELGARTVQAAAYRFLHPNCRLIMWAGLSEHTEKGRGHARETLRRAVLPFSDAVLVNGASAARYVQGLGVPQNKLFVTLDTTDHTQFIDLMLERKPSEQHRLLYLGRLIERKGLGPFISVLSLWCSEHPKQSVEFWLVGDGPQREPLERIPLPQNLRLRWCGNFAHAEMAAFYSQAGICAFPSFSDEWGMVVNEAMAAGLPVLGSIYSQAVEHLVRDGVTGWTFRPDHRDEMYAAVSGALTTPIVKLQQMRVTARNQVKHLTSDFVASRVMEAVHFVQRDKRGCASVVADESLRGHR
jgi:glycosyltransferase involved in cell wall biosynthesis